MATLIVIFRRVVYIIHENEAGIHWVKAYSDQRKDRPNCQSPIEDIEYTSLVFSMAEVRILLDPNCNNTVKSHTLMLLEKNVL